MATLITGGAGYIGSHVAWAFIDAGRDVVIVDNLSNSTRATAPPAADFHEFDLADAQRLRTLFERSSIDSIIHLAGSIVVPESIEAPLAYYANNTSNSVSLFQEAVRHGVKHVVFSSTAAVYAPTTKSMVAETDALGPLSPYGLSKLMVEHILEHTSNAHDLRYAALRYFNVAGADPQGRTGQSTPNATHLIKVAVQTALGRRNALTIFGRDYETPDGTCIRDFIHVTDLANAHVAALTYLENHGSPQTLNVGYGKGASVLDVVGAVERVTGRPLPTQDGQRRPGDAPSLVADSSRLRGLLDWQPRHQSLDEIVTGALAWEKTLSPA